MDTLIQSINTQFGNVEESESITLSTFLDPRFKNLGFSSENIVSELKSKAQELIANKLKQNYDKHQNQQQV